MTGRTASNPMGWPSARVLFHATVPAIDPTVSAPWRIAKLQNLCVKPTGQTSRWAAPLLPGALVCKTMIPCCAAVPMPTCHRCLWHFGGLGQRRLLRAQRGQAPPWQARHQALPQNEQGGLSAKVSKVKLVITDQTCPLMLEAPLAPGRLQHTNRRVPVERQHALPFAPLDENVVANHRCKYRQGLYPSDCNPQGIVVAKVLSLAAYSRSIATMRAISRLRSASAFSPATERRAASFNCAVRRRSS